VAGGTAVYRAEIARAYACSEGLPLRLCEDLKRFPENGWSLFGLAAALKAQGKSADAAAVQQRFSKAWSAADVKLTASRF
jgi:hypothetical protein